MHGAHCRQLRRGETVWRRRTVGTDVARGGMSVDRPPRRHRTGESAASTGGALERGARTIRRKITLAVSCSQRRVGA